MTNAPMSEDVRDRLKEEARLEWLKIQKAPSLSIMYALGGDPEKGYVHGPFPEFNPSWLEEEYPVYVLNPNGAGRLAIAEMALHCSRLCPEQVQHLVDLDRTALSANEAALVDAAIEGARPAEADPAHPPPATAGSFRDQLRARAQRDGASSFQRDRPRSAG